MRDSSDHWQFLKWKQLVSFMSSTILVTSISLSVALHSMAEETMYFSNSTKSLFLTPRVYSWQLELVYLVLLKTSQEDRSMQKTHPYTWIWLSGHISCWRNVQHVVDVYSIWRVVKGYEGLWRVVMLVHLTKTGFMIYMNSNVIRMSDMMSVPNVLTCDWTVRDCYDYGWIDDNVKVTVMLNICHVTC